MEKAQVAAILDETAALLELRGGNPYEVRAYQNAARAVGAYDGDLEAAARDGSLASIPGLGKTTATRVAELVTTGHMAFYEKLLDEVPAGLRQMLRISGLGPKRVRLIHEALGITTLDALREAGEQNKIAALPGFGAKSQEKILKGLTFLTEHASQHRFDAAYQAATALVEALRERAPQLVRLSVAGSLRRRKETVKDVDIVASVPIGAGDATRAAVMEAFVTLPGVADIVARGNTKTSVTLQSGLAVDLRLVADDEYPYALHHFTGSREHHIALRGRALDSGLKINEYGVFRGDQRIPAADEHEFYAALGMAYIEPELREDRGEIEAALAGTLPTLVTVDDIRGMLHVHSTWSDGQATIREMAEATLALGKQYLGVCDHSQAASYASGLSPAAVRRQHEEIDQLNEEFAGRLRILKGTECDILKDGALDYDDATLASFDFVVASIHSNFQLPPEEQTQRLLRALEHPYCSILGHPTGRILLEREGYNPNLEVVIARAGELGVAIELNGDPHRFDLDWRWLRYATERGVRIPITTDAHSPAGLLNIAYGVGVGRKGWLTPAEVLNTLPVDDIMAFFTEQRRKRGA